MKAPHNAALLLTTFLFSPHDAEAIMIGDEVCITNYIMDQFCIKLGHFKDDTKTMTLGNPEKHSFHCLLDVPECKNSGYVVLTDKDEDTDLHCIGYRLEETDTVLEAGFAAGREGYCTDCTGNLFMPEYGWQATVKGIVKELGDATAGIAGAPLLENIIIMDAGVECNATTTATPVCMAPPAEPDTTIKAPMIVADISPQSCPDTLDKMKVIDDKATLYLAVLPSIPPGSDNGIFCARLEAENDGWIGLGFSPDGLMFGSDAVVGIPDEESVLKYGLTYEALVMDDSKQNLRDVSINQVDGKTIMEFAKLLVEDGEIPIKEEGNNWFIYAMGGERFGHHNKARTFVVNFAELAISDSISAPTPVATEPPARDCTKQMCEETLSPDYLMKYQINVPSDTTTEGCMGCTISMELIYNDEAWVGIAFSTDGNMIGSEAVIGNPGDGSVLKYEMGSKETSGVTPFPQDQQTLSDTSVEVKGGETIVKFTKIMKEPGEIEITTGDNGFLWAYGTGNALGYHKAKASFALNLSSGVFETVTTPNKAAWLAHGIMAFLAWGVFIPFAVQSSLLRSFLPSGPLWFNLHRAFNNTAFAFTIIIFAIAVAFSSKERGFDATHFHDNHGKMGLAMFIIAFFQVAGGLFRPHVADAPEDKTPVRKGWEVGHRVLGVILLACGFWQMREGINQFAAKYSVSESNEDNLAIAYWVWIGIMSTAIVLGVFLKLKKSGEKDNTDNNHAPLPDDTAADDP